jgi:hydroxyethylthiazole kinase-like uncharacterized protein yjeF
MTSAILEVAALRHIESQQAHAVTPSLMERAGACAAHIAQQMLPPHSGPPLIIAGPGNNGGDALVVARLLKAAGYAPQVLFVGDPARLPADAQQALAGWLATGASCITAYPAGNFGLMIDGLFGIGLQRPISAPYSDWIQQINRSHCPVLALDIPSGLNANTGQATGAVINAAQTVSFIALKPGLLTADGPDFCGQITLCDLGLDLPAAADISIGRQTTPELFKTHLQPRPHNSHKGSFGSVSVIGGAPGMSGAAFLAGRAALRLGAGRVYLGMLDGCALDPCQPELMLRSPQEVLTLATVLAIGPGLGQSSQAESLLAQALNSPLPLVIDADALNLLALHAQRLKQLAVRPAPTFLTPHPAEAARLLGMTTAAVQADRLSAARCLAERLRVHVALKGCGTIIAHPDGCWQINSSGNPALATAGSGDVLTGILSALLAQGWPAAAALPAAVHLHGAAADACVLSGSGPIGLTAGEVIDSARRLLNNWVRHFNEPLQCALPSPESILT